jgi:hypothetical protein
MRSPALRADNPSGGPTCLRCRESDPPVAAIYPPNQVSKSVTIAAAGCAGDPPLAALVRRNFDIGIADHRMTTDRLL